jgi:sugar O-acyltransferase (sialic acid O-acetyltransferase NeuD family)
MIIYGASGHGKVIIEILELNGLKPSEIWDDAPSDSIMWQYRVCRPNYNELPKDKSMVIAIGNNKIRQKIAKRNEQYFSFFPAIHPDTTISNRTEIGEGTAIMAGVVINADVVIGAHCIINTSAVIEHDCTIGDFAHISPNATLCGNVSIGDGTHIGAGAVVIPGVRIGKWCTIGAGSVIIRDVPDNVTVVGNPGRIIKVAEMVS